jgi:hypothetical protein
VGQLDENDVIGRRLEPILYQSSINNVCQTVTVQKLFDVIDFGWKLNMRGKN